MLTALPHWSLRRPIVAALYLVLFGLIRQLSLLREEFRQLKLILHSELRRRAASRRALPCPSSFLFFVFLHYYSVAFCQLCFYNKDGIGLDWHNQHVIQHSKRPPFTITGSTGASKTIASLQGRRHRATVGHGSFNPPPAKILRE